MNAFQRQIQKSNVILRSYIKLFHKNNNDQQKGNCTKNPKFSPSINNMPDMNLGKQFAQYHCKFNTCDKIFHCKAKLTRHQKTHTSLKKHVCEKCGNTYCESGSLRNHILAKHSNRERPHRCDQCNLAFDVRSTLLRHIRTHTGERPFGCDVCKKLYPSKSYLNRHKKV